MSILYLPGGRVEDFATQVKFDEISRQWPAVAQTISPTLGNGWAIQASFGHKVTKTHDGMVFIVGAYNGLACTGIDAFALPVGWRPTTGIIDATAMYYNGVQRLLAISRVTSAGQVQFFRGDGNLPVNSDFAVNMSFSTTS